MEVKELLKIAREKLAEQKTKKAAAAMGGSTNTQTKANVEAKALKRYGVKSFAELIGTKNQPGINIGSKKYAYLTENEKQMVKELKENVDIAVMCSQLFQIPVSETKHFTDVVQFQMKAFGIDSGNEGFDWIPTQVSDVYIDEFNLERKVAGLFTEIRMPSNPYKMPVLSGGAIARKANPTVAMGTKQVFKTNLSITLDAEKLTNQYLLPEELSEDSAPDIMRAIRQELIEGQEKAVEIAVLEGDVDGTMHVNSQLPDVAPGTAIAAISDTPEKIFDGLRKRALASLLKGSISAAGSLSETHMQKARMCLGKYGIDPSALAIITGVKGYNHLLDLEDVRTLDKYGPQATILSGELAKYEGIPVIVSEYLREDTAATGKNTGVEADDVKLSIMYVNRKRWFIGTRRAINVFVEKNQTDRDAWDMVSFARKAFNGILKVDASNYATESTVSLIYNISA